MEPASKIPIPTRTILIDTPYQLIPPTESIETLSEPNHVLSQTALRLSKKIFMIWKDLAALHQLRKYLRADISHQYTLLSRSMRALKDNGTISKQLDVTLQTKLESSIKICLDLI